MREIKFRRAYFTDRERTKFSHFSVWGVNIGDAVFIAPASNNFTDSFTDQQFTGLKDKNGKEIYEGDILSGYLDSANFAIGGYGGLTEVRSVEYDAKRAVFTTAYMSHQHNLPLSDYTLGEMIEAYWELTVIGNIYEHGHLLEKV